MSAAPRGWRSWRTRKDFRAADGVLLVLRDPPPPPPPSPGQPPTVPGDPAEGSEILLAVCDDGTAIALAGHVDLGTGLRTAYGQIVAEELDLPLARVEVVLGDTARAPNQGPTIASSSIQIHARPLQLAAAQARAWLVATTLPDTLENPVTVISSNQLSEVALSKRSPSQRPSIARSSTSWGLR